MPVDDTVYLPEDEIKIVDDRQMLPSPEIFDPNPGAFYANMVSQLPQAVLDEIGDEFVQLVQADDDARKDFIETYKAAIKATGRDGGVGADSRGDTRIVKHVLLNEARVHAHARLMAEMNPRPTQQKFKSVGTPSPEIRDRRDRLEEFSNYQLNNVIQGYENTLSRHFVHLCLVGTSYLKTFWDDRTGAPAVEHISADRLILAPDTVDLFTSKRYSHEYEITVNEYNRYCKSGYFHYYDDVAMKGADTSPVPDITKEVSGIEIHSANDREEQKSKKTITLYDIYTTYKFDGFHEFADDGPEVESPYIITVEKETGKVVRVVPNWNPDDPLVRRPIQNIIMFKFLDGHGPVGEGFYHLIGGLDKASTAALRDNLEASAMNLNRPMFVGNGVQGGILNARKGEMIKVKRGDKIKDSFFDFPVLPPDQTMLALMGSMEENARKVSLVTDVRMEEAAKSNLPGVTMTALIEQGQIAHTGVHKRVHANMTELYKRIMTLNWLYQPQQWQFNNTGRDIIMYREDFNPNTIDVIPTSDPNVASHTMRMAQAQDAYSIAVNHPDILDVKIAIQRLFQVSRIADWEEYFIQDEMPPRLDAVSENVRAMKGQPILAYDDQDHPSHIDTHIAFFNDPVLGASAFGEQGRALLYEHIMDHICRYYVQQMMMGINMPITGEPMDPQTEAIITARAAELVAQSPMVYELRSVMTVAEDPAVETARQMAELDMEIKKMEAIQNMNERQQKMMDEKVAARERLNAQIQDIRAKSMVKASAEQQNTQLKIENMETTHQLELNQAVQDARNEMRIENEKHRQEMQQDWEAHKLEMAAEREKLMLEIQKKEEEIKALKQKTEEQKKQGFFSRNKDSK